MRNIIIQIIILVFTSQLIGQTIYSGLNVPYDPCNPCSGDNITYGATAYFNQPNQVASDFGPRYVKRKNKPDTPYDWHGGIDYNGFVGDGNDDFGYRLRAIVGGTIYAIGSNAKLKYIVIDGADHDFGYLHIFTNTIPSVNNPVIGGDCKLVRLNGLPVRFGILIPHNGQHRLLAVCPDNNCNTETYTIPDTQTILTATNQVAAGDIIGTLGTSGDVGAHLHLNRYESLSACNDYANCDNYMLNPLEHVEHTGVNYACRFHNHSTPQTAPENEPQGFDNTHIGYPGTKSSTIMVRPRLNDGGNGNYYTAGTFNIRDVNLEIKPASGGSYSQLKGNNYESKILMGATDLYPHAYPSYINKSSESSQGGWSRQGIYNFAYRDAGDPHRGPYSTSGGRPYDDFYFPFYHRVHKASPLNGGTITFADIPTDARYNDGNYLLRAKVTDVRGTLKTIETNITLDNFLPYLTDVNIRFNGDQLYQVIREGNEGSTETDDGYIFNTTYDYPPNPDYYPINTLTLEVLTSEPMQNVRYALKKAGPTTFPNPVPMTQHLANKLLWTATITSSNIERTCYNLEIKGQDLSENELIHVYNQTNHNKDNIKMMIPTRKGKGSNMDWHNYPNNIESDQIDFCIEDCDYKIKSDQTTVRRGRSDDPCQGLSSLVSSLTYISCVHARIILDGQGFNPSAYTIRWTDEIGNLLPQYNDMYVIDVTEAGMYCYNVEANEDCCKVTGCVDILSSMMHEAAIPLSADIKNQCPGDVTSAGIDLHIGQGNYQVEWYVKLPIPFPTPTIRIQSHTNVTNGSGLEDLYGINAGTYIVSVTDQNGCAATAQYSVGISDLSMYGDVFSYCDGTGSISTGADGGAPEYQYSWSNGWQHPETQTLNAGTYTVTVTDEDGCTLSEQFTIPDILTVSANASPVCQEGNGAIALTVSGGRQPYTYLWSNGATTRDISGLDAGTFTVTVTDEDGCSVVAVAEVKIGWEVYLSTPTISDATCNEPNSGSIIFPLNPAFSGLYPLTYQWSNGANTRSIENLMAGTYTITVTGADGCYATQTYTVHVNTDINIFDSTSDICHGTGNITLSTVEDCTFQWDPTESGSPIFEDNFSILFVSDIGQYCVNITNAHTGCRIRKCYDVGIKDFELTGINAFKSCKFQNTGEAEVLHNYIYPLSYTWKNAETNEIVSVSKKAKPLGQGHYVVEVVNSCGYIISADVEIEADDFDVNFDVVNGCGHSDYDYISKSFIGKFGTLNLTVNGSNPPFIVDLYPTDTNSKAPKIKRVLHDFSNIIDITNLWDTEYNLTIRDAKGCSYNNTIRFQSTFVGVQREEIIQPCSDGNDGVIKYYIFNPLGNQINAYYNGINIFSTNKHSDVFIQTDQIKGNSNLSWSAGDCNFKTSVYLDGLPTEKRLYKYDKNTNMCHYDEYCNDVLLSKDSYWENAYIDLKNATTTSCNAPIKCRDTEVEERDDKLTRIKGGEYYHLASSITQLHPYPLLIGEDIDKVLKFGPCREWYFCPLSMRLWGTGPIGDFLDPCQLFSPGTWGESNIKHGTCVYMDCHCGPPRPPFCLEYFDYPGGNIIKSFENCLPVTLNVARLLLMKDQLKDIFKNYDQDTELAIFINQTLASSERRNKSICSNISFCRKTLTILYSDIDEYKQCGYDSKIKATNSKAFVINEYGKLQEVLITSEYYPHCIITDTGAAICENSLPIILCNDEEEEEEEEYPFPPIPRRACPIYFMDTTTTTSRILNCDDKTTGLVYNRERDEFIHFWESNQEVDTLFLYGDIKTNNLFQKQNHIFPKITLQPGSKIHRADFIHGSLFITTEFQNRYYLSRYDDNGHFIWRKNLESTLALIANELDNGNVEILTYDNTNHLYSMTDMTMQGQFSNTTNINTLIPEHTVIHMDNKSIFYYMQNNHQIVFRQPNGHNKVIPIPAQVVPKAIKSLPNGNIVLAGNYAESFDFRGQQFNANGKTNITFLQFTHNGSPVSANIIPTDRDEFLEGFVITPNHEAAYYGRYIEAVYAYHDSTDIRIDSCIFTGIISLDTIACNASATDLTFDSESCRLSWLLGPQEYITTLQANDGQVWYDSYIPTDTDSSGVVTCSVQGNASYRLVQSKPGCPDIFSDSITVLCDTTPCPQISIESDIDTSCYLFQLSHAQNHTFSLSVKTWQTDTLDLQFNDTLSFSVEDTMQVFNYCALPHEFWCYNYGQIKISCLDCTPGCTPFVYDWSCIPRVSGDHNLSSDKAAILFYPNPFATGINMEAKSEKHEQVTLDVFNPIGQKIFSRSLSLMPGNNDYYLQEFEALPPGIYTITLQRQLHKYTSRVIKIL